MSAAARRAGPRWKSAAAASPSQYIAGLPPDRAPVIKRLRRILRQNLPKGFGETIDYGMICWVVPRALHPAGYHVDPSRGLPFIALASRKQYVALYRMGLHADRSSRGSRPNGRSTPRRSSTSAHPAGAFESRRTSPTA